MTSARDIIDTLPVGAKFKIKNPSASAPEYTITEELGVRYARGVGDRGREVRHALTDGGGTFTAWYASDLVVTHSPDETGRSTAEPVTPEQTYDSYHPSMLPMLGKVTQLAEDRGLCPEFDRILKDIDAPDRAEIKRLTQPKANAPTGTGVWALRRRELSETGDMEEFSDLFLHTERGWYRIGNLTATRSKLSPEEIERIFTNNEPVRLTYSEEV